MEFAETRLDRTGVSTNVGGAARVGEGIPSVTSRHHDITVGSQCIPRGYQARGRSRASRGGAPANRREALVGPFERVQVGGVVQIERRIGETHDPPPGRRAPRL